MTNDLIERYIYAATKRLPSKITDDVSAELRTIIEDMLTERCGDATPTEKDIKIVLTELGTPRELYEQYNPDADKCLIGTPYYSTYKYVMKIVLICAGLGMILAMIISAFVDKGNTPDVVSLIIKIFSSVPTALLEAFAIVTIIFAVFSYKNIDIKLESDSIENLPPVPTKKAKISKTESIIGIAFAVVFLIVFLFCPQIIGGYFSDINEWIPFFNVETIYSIWFILVGISISTVIEKIVKLLEGRYNKKVMLVSVITNVIGGVLTAVWLTTGNLINQDFISRIIDTVGDSNFAIYVFTNFQWLLLMCVIVALVIDTVETVVKTVRAHN